MMGCLPMTNSLFAQMRDNFVVPVFNSYGLPLAARRYFRDAIAKVSRDNPSVTINRRVDLEVTGMRIWVTLL